MNLFTAGRSQAAEPLDEQWVLDALPPFPAVALHALHLMAGTETSLHELCDLIRSDPAFSGAVLRLANSPLIGFSKEITSVVQAAMLLGFRRLKRVVIAIAVKVYVEGSYTPLLRACWRHSVACARIAERCASGAPFDPDAAYTAGIMHDIGRFALLVSMPRSYARVAEEPANQPSDLLHHERKVCGIDHCQAGLALVNAWQLPREFAEITACHHDTLVAANAVVSLLRPSCMLADALGFSVVSYRSSRRYEEIVAQFPEAAYAALPASRRELASDIKKGIKLLESV